MKTVFVPSSLIDNQPVTVRVQLPAAWLARAFADWIEQHSEEFTEHMLANDGVRLEWASTAERVDNGEIAIVFSRSWRRLPAGIEE